MTNNPASNLFISPRILLVDDDAGIREEFRQSFEDYGVIAASSGEEALKILKKPHEIDLVILDVRMSGMSGIEALDNIKRIAPDVRVVIFTGYGSKDLAVEALRARADDFIEKSLDTHALRKTIETNLEYKKRFQYGPGIDNKIAQVKELLLRNAHKKVTLQDAASAVFLSPKYLSRVFKQFTKKGFSDFKLSCKMDHAKKLLMKTGGTVEEISDNLGYANPESFIRQFKKIAKLTPSQFRAKVRRSKKQYSYLKKT
jgi:two-component system, response regulator YesN